VKKREKNEFGVKSDNRLKESKKIKLKEYYIRSKKINNERNK